MVETAVGPIDSVRTSESAVAAGKVVSQREAKLLEGLLAGKSAEVAVREAGYVCRDSGSATAIAEHVRGKFTDRNGALVVALDGVGVTIGTLAEKIKDGLGATKPVFAGRKLVGHTPDLGMRHKYLETALDVVGGRAPTKQITETTIKTHEQTIAIVAGIKENPEILERIRQRLEQRRTITVTAQEVTDG